MTTDKEVEALRAEVEHLQASVTALEGKRKLNQGGTHGRRTVRYQTSANLCPRPGIQNDNENSLPVSDAAETLLGVSSHDPGVIVPAGMVWGTPAYLTEAGVSLNGRRNRFLRTASSLRWLAM